MSEAVKKSDLIEGDPFGEIAKSIQAAQQELNKYNEQLATVSKSFADISNGTKATIVDLQKLTEVEKAANAAAEQSKRNKADLINLGKTEKVILTEKEKLQQKLESLNTKEATDTAKLRAEISAKNREIKLAIEQEQKLAASNNENLGTLERLSASNRALTLERSKLNLETEQGRTRLTEINAKIDENNAFIKSNVDALGQQRMNVGNYAQSVEEALQSTGLFSRQLSQLNTVKRTLSAATKVFSTSTKDATKSTDGMTGAVNKSTKALLMNPIVLVVAVIIAYTAAMVAFLTSTQEGMDKLNDILAPLIGGFKAFIGVLQDIGGPVFSMVVDSFNILKNVFILGFGLIQKGILNLRIAWNEFWGDTEEADELKDRLNEVNKSMDEAANSIKKSGQNIVENYGKIRDIVGDTNNRLSKAAELQREINRLTIENRREEIAMQVPMAENNRLIAEQREILNDTTRSQQERQEALLKTKKAIEENLQREIAFEQKKLRIMELQTKFNATSDAEYLEIEKQKAAIIGLETNAQQQLNGLVRKEVQLKREAAAEAKELNKAAQERKKILSDVQDIEQQIEIEKQRRRLEELEREGASMDEILAQRRKIGEAEIKLEQDRFDRLAKISGWSREQRLLEETKLKQALLQIEWKFDDDVRGIREKEPKEIAKTNEEIIKEEIAALERISAEKKLFNLNTIEDDKELKDAELQREIDLIDAKLSLLEKFADTEEEMTKLRIKRAELARKGVEKEVKKEDESQKLLTESIAKAQKTAVDAINKRMSRQMDAAKKEEELANAQIQRLTDLANNGRILDEQSLKDAEQRRRDALKEQARLAKQQERAQFIQAALANITNQLKNGKSTGEAVSSTVGLQSALKALFAGFAGFYKGTNNAPEGLAWVDEKGAEIHTDKHGRVKDYGSDSGARLKFLEKGDKIIPHAKSMELLSGLPSVREPKGVQIDPSLRLLEEQNRILKNAMESKITAEELGRVIHLTTEDKKGNLSRINRYKYHR